MKVLVNGIGDMGTTLLQVLTAHWDVLDAETVLAHAPTVHSRQHAMLERLKDLGVVLVGDHYPAQSRLAEVAHGIDHVFDTCGPVPDSREHAEQAVLRALSGGETSDVVTHEIETARSPAIGGLDPLPLLRFRVRLASSPCVEQVRDRIGRTAYVASTGLSDPAEVFDVGRRFGLGGRLYHQAIFLDDQLHVEAGVVHGSAFVPREGNTVLATMAAYLRATRDECEASRRLDQLAESLLLRDI